MNVPYTTWVWPRRWKKKLPNFFSPKMAHKVATSVIMKKCNFNYLVGQIECPWCKRERGRFSNHRGWRFEAHPSSSSFLGAFFCLLHATAKARKAIWDTFYKLNWIFLWKTAIQKVATLDSGWCAVCRAVISDTRDLRFESSHRQIYFLPTVLKTRK